MSPLIFDCHHWGMGTPSIWCVEDKDVVQIPTVNWRVPPQRVIQPQHVEKLWGREEHSLGHRWEGRWVTKCL